MANLGKRAKPKRVRVFLDATYIWSTDHKTGIQRVVRNILDLSRRLGEKLDIVCQPVVWSSGHFHPIGWPITSKEGVGLLVRVRRQIRKVLEFILPRALWLLIQIFYTYAKQLVKRFRPSGLGLPPPVKFKEENILVLLDSSWEIPFWETIRKLRKSGVKVGFVVYDLIPVISPQFCDAALVFAFHSWLTKAITQTDFSLSISEATRAHLEFYLKRSRIKNPPKTDSFRLGADFIKHEGESQVVREKVREVFEKRGFKPYIAVGTVEPRKNHQYLLDAFELLWKRGLEGRLVLIGKVGWMIEPLIERIKNHREFGKRLFMFNDLSDAELVFAYKNAKALLLPSIIEGFGLPIIETLHYKLPVFASDIPVFREVGGDFCAYFPLDSPYVLAQLISDFEKTGHFPAKRAPGEFRWPNWEESTKEFLEKVLFLSKRP